MFRRSDLVRLAVFAILGWACTQAGRADHFTVSVNTSGAAGTTGGIYLNLSPGNNSDPASVSIDSFMIDAPGGLISGDPNPGGDFPPGSTPGADVTGSLTSLPLILRNTAQTNDYLQYLTFGNQIVFDFTFNLPATFTGDPSTFGFEITGADGLSSIFPVDPITNLNVEMTFDQTGALSFTNTSSEITVTPSVPEPGSLILLVTVASALFTLRTRVGLRAGDSGTSRPSGDRL